MTTPVEPKTEIAHPQVDEKRRRLAKGGLAAPIVLGTLLSRPVLGAAPYNCTLSGQMSGNVSSHGDPVPCASLGRSPVYWRQPQKDWPVYTYGSGMIAGNFKPIATPTSDGSRQSDEGTLFTTAGFAHAFQIAADTTTTTVTKRRKTQTVTETVYRVAAYPDVSLGGNATLLQIVAAEGNDNKLVSLGRAAVASLLNAYHYAPNYPLTPREVVAMFNAVYAGGTYQVNATTFWNRNQVMTYFESLYG